MAVLVPNVDFICLYDMSVSFLDTYMRMTLYFLYVFTYMYASVYICIYAYI